MSLGLAGGLHLGLVRRSGAAVVPLQLAKWEPAHAADNHILGVTKTTAQMWQEDISIDTFTPAKVVDGVGYRQLGAGEDAVCSTPALWAALDVNAKGGVIFVVHYILSAPASSYADIYVRLYGGGQTKLYFAALSTDAGIGPSERDLNYGHGYENLGPTPTGEHRVSFRISPTAIEYAVDGGSVRRGTLSVGSFALTTNVSVMLECLSSTAGVPSTICHHVHFYDPATVIGDAALIALST